MRPLTERAYLQQVMNDGIWLDDVGDEDGDDQPPRWLADEAVRACIPALLECDRVREERERLREEESSLRMWLQEEQSKLRMTLDKLKDSPDMAYQIELQLGELWNVSQHWQHSLDRYGFDASTWLAGPDKPDYLCRIGADRPSTADDGLPSDDDAPTISNASDSGSSVGEEDEEVLLELVEEEVRRNVRIGVEQEDKLLEEPELDVGRSISGQTYGELAEGPLLGFLEDVSKLTAERILRNGVSCGRFTSDADCVQRLTSGDRWFDGSIISVVGEALVAGSISAPKATHVTPRVLDRLEQLLENNVPAVRDEVVPFILKHVGEIATSQDKIWLLPAHVPNHWTLVAIDFQQDSIRFHDSLPARIGAERDEKRVRGGVQELLRFVWSHKRPGEEPPELKWVSELRGRRQKNGYDCGAFTLADMATYIRWGIASSWVQDDMKAWRASIVAFLSELPKVVRLVGPGRNRTKDAGLAIDMDAEGVIGLLEGLILVVEELLTVSGAPETVLDSMAGLLTPHMDDTPSRGAPPVHMVIRDLRRIGIEELLAVFDTVVGAPMRSATPFRELLRGAGAPKWPSTDLPGSQDAGPAQLRHSSPP
ncbi:hypothetical protein M422DRAFT_257363 [Sphaerobolus stellatus SS14]|uniref:Ubiquitin-like protease family profile domain-containing protein n=1 Tax=Sphaerobolus stellatus (strain SS14) TaxID=990650 RepID=A0A0C9UXZ4_SPHS4|nr:hypothetical protein M422DRAFT_257363 [Sphaerobolus stellatus SS14]